jgi:hypothetical protein
MIASFDQENTRDKMSSVAKMQGEEQQAAGAAVRVRMDGCGDGIGVGIVAVPRYSKQTADAGLVRSEGDRAGCAREGGGGGGSRQSEDVQGRERSYPSLTGLLATAAAAVASVVDELSASDSESRYPMPCHHECSVSVSTIPTRSEPAADF